MTKWSAYTTLIIEKSSKKKNNINIAEAIIAGHKPIKQMHVVCCTKALVYTRSEVESDP